MTRTFCVSFVCAIAATALVARAHDPVEQPTNGLPPCGVYVSPDAFHAMYPTGIGPVGITAAEHLVSGGAAGQGVCGPMGQSPPGVGMQIMELNLPSMMSAMASINNGAPFPVSAPAIFSVRVLGLTPTTFETEMLQLDISGGTLPAGVMIRESPTLASLGMTTITGAGPFMIGSFFDIFTELSIDGGQTWVPDSAGPVHMHYVPEPASGGLLVLGLAALLRRRARA